MQRVVAQNDNADEKPDVWKSIVDDFLKDLLHEHFIHIKHQLSGVRNKLLLVIAIAVLCQLYIWSFNNTISEENVESLIQRCIEDRYGPLFGESLKKEVDEFRSSYLNNLELDISYMKETVWHLDTAIHEIETKFYDLFGLVENVSSYLNTFELNITTVKETVEQIDTDAHELQTKIESTEKYLYEQLETTRKSLTILEISLDALDSRLKHIQSLADALGSLQTKYEENIEPNLFNKGSLLLALHFLFLLMLIMMMSQYRLYKLIRSAEPVQSHRKNKKP